MWCKECPRACRNFIQLALEGYYEETLFHRVVPGFLVQAGDPTGTGQGGRSIWAGEDAGNLRIVESHSRLSFNRRGLLGMAATVDSPDLGSQFFFTLDRAEELDRKHTLFGRIVGETIFNLLRIGEVELEDGSDRPLYPPKIINVSVLVNPFDDIVPRLLDDVKARKTEKKKPEAKPVAVVKKNKALLSFQDDEEDDVNNAFSGMISSHDVLDDPTLSKEQVETLPVAHQKKESTEQSKVKDPSAYERIKLEREANLKKIEASIASVQQQIKGIDTEASVAAAATEAAPKKPRIDSVSALIGRTGKAKNPKTLSLLQQQQQFYRSKPNVIVGKRAANQIQEVNTLLTLNAFREKLQTVSDPSALEKAASNAPEQEGRVLEICKLHGLVNCLSCKDTFGVDDETGAIGEEGWLMHRLVFDKDTGYKEIREELTNLVVIDPRERAKEIKKQK